MQYMLYRTICLVTNKIYYGVHGTDNLDDGYLGSGKFLNLAIKKYGKEKFIRQVVYIFDQEDIAYALEEQVVTESFILRKDVYNCAVGGRKGKHSFSAEGLLKLKENGKKMMANPLYRAKLMEAGIAALKKLSPEQKAKRYKNCGGLYGPDHARKISEKAKVRCRGQGNVAYGTCWVFNLVLESSKRIPKDDLNEWIKEGWHKGRKMKF